MLFYKLMLDMLRCVNCMTGSSKEKRAEKKIFRKRYTQRRHKLYKNVVI